MKIRPNDTGAITIHRNPTHTDDDERTSTLLWMTGQLGNCGTSEHPYAAACKHVALSSFETMAAHLTQTLPQHTG